MPTSATLVLKPGWVEPSWRRFRVVDSLFLGPEKLIWFIFLFKKDIFKASLRSWNVNLHISSYNIIIISLLHCTTSSSHRFWTCVGSSWRRNKLLSGELSISSAPSASLASLLPLHPRKSIRLTFLPPHQRNIQPETGGGFRLLILLSTASISSARVRHTHAVSFLYVLFYAKPRH